MRREAGRFAVTGFIMAALLCVALPLLAQQAWVPAADTPRAQVPEQYRWSLAALFAEPAQWREAFDKVAADIPLLDLCRGKLGQDAAKTLRCLDLLDRLRLEKEALDAYAFQWWSVEMEDARAQELREKSTALATRLEEAASFFEPELMEVETSAWEQMLKAEEGLAKFSHPFADLKRRQRHLLSPREESLVALTLPMREGPYYVMNAMMQEIDFPRIRDEQGNEAHLGPASFPRYRGSVDRNVRMQAVTAYFATLERYKTTLATSLATSVKGAVFEAKARNYSSSLEMALDADNVPTAVYDTLIEVTGRNLPKTLHRYVALRKRLMKLDKIHYYDLYNPLFPDFRKEVPYDEALKAIPESLEPMGKDYLAVLTAGMMPGSGWTDVYANSGKKGGAYCNAAYGTHPFVLLNYMNELDDVFTTTHEFGHAMHFLLSSKAQPHAVADPPILLAEVASTFQEEMLLHHLLQKAKTPRERLVLLNKRVENIRLTITRQTMFAQFERRIHAHVEAGEALTAQALSAIYRELVEQYFGPGFTIDENDHMEWAYVPHFYYNFYVYKYSTGLMAAIVFARRILEGRPGAVEQYKGLLAAGGNDYPLAILERAGLDFTKPDIVQSTYDLFAETLDEMEKLL